MSIEELDSEQMEAEARKQGWKPEEEWKGEPPKRGFVSAEEFLRAGETSLPLQAKKNEELVNENETLKERFETLEQKFGRYADMMDKALTTQKALAQAKVEENRRLLEELQQRRVEAVSEADGQKFAETEAEIKRVEQDLQDDMQHLNSGVQEWLAANEWYKNDPDLAAVADGVSLRLKDEKPGLQGRAHLDELTERVKKLMPHKFENPNRSKAPPVGDSRRTPPSNGRSFDDLPDDAKQAYYDFKEMIEGTGRKYPKEKYLATYEWE